MNNTAGERPVIIGEVLFDCFPDGTSVMGGAPFNVAWHMQGLGLSPLLITAVGDDAQGEQVITAMTKWGMDTRGVQIDKQHPTGKVVVSLEGSIPSYDIVENQAWDFIDSVKTQSLLAATNNALLYHGSLVSRTATSRKSLDAIAEQAGLPAFVDINLRSPWWTRDDIEHSLHRAHWSKLNDEELLEIMKADRDVESLSEADLLSLAEGCLDTYKLDLLIVTLGAKGAFCVTAEGIVQALPVMAEHLVDTVGAGDSFSAVMIAGLIHQWPLNTSLERALQFAALICGIRGATTTDFSLYEAAMRSWHRAA